MTPLAFRSGRWGFDAEVARNILRLGYRIDTSIVGTGIWPRLFARFSSTLYVHGDLLYQPKSERRSCGDSSQHRLPPWRVSVLCEVGAKAQKWLASRAQARRSSIEIACAPKGVALSRNGERREHDSALAADEEAGLRGSESRIPFLCPHGRMRTVHTHESRRVSLFGQVREVAALCEKGGRRIYRSFRRREVALHRLGGVGVDSGFAQCHGYVPCWFCLADAVTSFY